MADGVGGVWRCNPWGIGSLVDEGSYLGADKGSGCQRGKGLRSLRIHLLSLNLTHLTMFPHIHALHIVSEIFQMNFQLDDPPR